MGCCTSKKASSPSTIPNNKKQSAFEAPEIKNTPGGANDNHNLNQRRQFQEISASNKEDRHNDTPEDGLGDEEQ